MKITIELSDNELKGIKAYLMELDGEKPTKQDIEIYIKGIVSTTLYSPAESVSNYINNCQNG